MSEPKCKHCGDDLELCDVVKKSDSKWFQGPVGFKIKNPMPMVFVPIKGQLGFFEVKL